MLHCYPAENNYFLEVLDMAFSVQSKKEPGVMRLFIYLVLFGMLLIGTVFLGRAFSQVLI